MEGLSSKNRIDANYIRRTKLKNSTNLMGQRVLLLVFVELIQYRDKP